MAESIADRWQRLLREAATKAGVWGKRITAVDVAPVMSQSEPPVLRGLKATFILAGSPAKERDLSVRDLDAHPDRAQRLAESMVAELTAALLNPGDSP